MAKLYFRYGAMGCGKTAQLLQVAFNYQERGMTPVVMKPKIDTKAKDKLRTRIGLERDIDYLIDIKDDIFKIIEEKYNNSNCILIDEAQFLTKEQVDQLMKIVVVKNIPVVCYGLRTDFLTNGFSGSTRLLEIKTICQCGRKALYNARFCNGKMVTKGEQIVIDDKENIKYVAMCPKCYYKNMEK